MPLAPGADKFDLGSNTRGAGESPISTELRLILNRIEREVLELRGAIEGVADELRNEIGEVAIDLEFLEKQYANLVFKGDLVKEDKSGIGRTITIESTSFPGYIYANGVKVDNLDTYPNKPCIKSIKGGATTEDDGPMPDTYPSNEIWLEKSKITGVERVWCDA